MNLDCPQEEKLVAFMRGELTLASADTVSQHLDACADCEATVANLENLHDTAIIALRHGGDGSSFALEPEFLAVRNAVAQLDAVGRHIYHSPKAAALHEVPLGEPSSLSASPEFGQIGPYQLLEKLGQGGMGTVYKAFHEKLQRIVAVKVLPTEKLQDPAAVARFEREMAAVGRLEPHPNLVQAFDAGEFNGQHYLAMEYVEGVDLSKLVKQRGPMPIAEACEVVRQAAIGLEHARQQGLVHRDIKPSNLMLCFPTGQKEWSATDASWSELSWSEGRHATPLVKILDLGLARLRGNDTADGELTQESQVMGTLDYMAPEQASSSKHVDIRADIFSLGATLYKLLTGQSIHHRENYDSEVAKIFALSRWSPPSIREVRGDIPIALDGILQNMLARDPAERIATPAEVAHALEPFAAGSASETFHTSSRGANAVASTTWAMGFPGITEVKRSPVHPRSRNLNWWAKPAYAGAIAVAFLAAVLAAATIYIKTGEGTLEIQSLDKDVKIIANRNGEEVAIVDLKTSTSVTLPAGRYELKLSGEKGGVRLSTDNFTLYRGDKRIVEVRRIPATGERQTQADSAKPQSGETAKDGGDSQPDALYTDSFDHPDQTRQFFDVRRQTVTIGDGQLLLRNRGCLVTKQMFPSGVSLRLRWKWTAGDPERLPDILSIVLRTKGQPDEKWPFEVTDGIHIMFTPHGGGGAAIIDKSNDKMLTNKGGLQMDKDQWHEVKVVDWGKRIEVYFRDMKTPCLIAQVPDRSSHHHIAIYNRESVGGTIKESVIDDLIVAVPAAQ